MKVKNKKNDLILEIQGRIIHWGLEAVVEVDDVLGAQLIEDGHELVEGEE